MTARPRDKRTKPPIRFLRVSEVQARTSLGRSTIYRWSAEGRFPRPVRLSARVVRWVEAEVDAWTRRQITESGSGGEAVAH